MYFFISWKIFRGTIFIIKSKQNDIWSREKNFYLKYLILRVRNKHIKYVFLLRDFKESTIKIIISPIICNNIFAIIYVYAMKYLNIIFMK